MPKFNLLVHINAYSDDSYSNSPTLNLTKWHRDYSGINAEEPNGKSIKLQASESIELFNGVTATSSDGTTTYDISLKSGTTNTYSLQHNSGTAPIFKTSRSVGFDNTTQFTVTKNAKLLIFTISSGSFTSLISSGVIVGDEARISTDFNANNQGKFKVLSRTANSFTIENEIGLAETVTLSSSSGVMIYSSAGVQVGSKFEIKSGFSSVTLGTYEITDVYPSKIEFYSSESLPIETNIQSTIAIYQNAKKFVYIESDSKVSVIINGSSTFDIEPFTLGINKKPGMFLLNSYVYSATVTASPNAIANMFVVTAE